MQQLMYTDESGDGSSLNTNKIVTTIHQNVAIHPLNHPSSNGNPLGLDRTAARFAIQIDLAHNGD